MRPLRRWALALLASAIAMPALGAEAPSVVTPLPAAKSGQTLLRELNLTGQSGWLLVDLDSGRVLDSQNADAAFAPASVAKLPTAAFALDALGADHRFVTELLSTATPSGAVLRGDLVLKGGGNPELDTDALLPLVQRLSALGINRLDGRLLADGSALPQIPEIESNQGVDSTYNPSVSGLNLNFNRVHLKWDARKGKRTLSVEAAAERLSPQVDNVQVAVANGPGGPLFSLQQQGGREMWLMAARAYRGRAARWLPVKHPDIYAGEVLGTLGRDLGISLPRAEAGRAPRQAKSLARHESRPLGQILRDMLKYSTNLTAEVTGTAASRSVGIGVSTLRESADVMNAWAASVAGFPLGDPGFRFVNHSGLSTESRVSPRRMVELLAAFGRRAPAQDAIHPRLPGAMAGYLKPHNVAAKSLPLDYNRLQVVAKTGTMSYIRGLAGYIATPGGRRLAFAIFSNDLARRGGGAQKVNKRWMSRARGFERALIRNWVLKVDGHGRT